MKSIAKEIEKLRAMKVPTLVERYREVFAKEPRIKHKEWLYKRIAWKIQEIRFGGLTTVAKRRLEELISEIDLPIEERTRTVVGALKGPRKPSDPVVGTILTRTYKGRDIRVEVTEDGFVWEDVPYRSLTAVVKAITGSHWNPSIFFGMKNRKRADGTGQ